jgi:hypothetical protein
MEHDTTFHAWLRQFQAPPGGKEPHRSVQVILAQNQSASI